MLTVNALSYLEKIVLGVTLAAPIGPVSVEMIKRGLAKGFWAAFSIRLGGAIGNTLCLLGTCFGLMHIMKYPFLLNTLGVMGAIFLIYMGICSFVKKNNQVDLEQGKKISNGIYLGIYLSIANPVALVFWPGIFAATMQNVKSINFSSFAESMLIVAGVLLWGFALSLALEAGNRFCNQRTIKIVTQISAAIMIWFGIKYILKILF